MLSIGNVASAFVLAAGLQVEDETAPLPSNTVTFFENEDDSLSLLQLRSGYGLVSPQHKSFSNSSSTQPQYTGHSFGCTGRETAVNVISCGLWGDPHQHKSFGDNGVPNSDGTGWYWMAKSKDESFHAQAFYRQDAYKEKPEESFTTISHFAFKFGDQKVFLDRENINGRWIWKYFWNGEEKRYSDTPMELGSVYWVNKAAGQMANLGGQGTSNTANVVAEQAGGDHERLSCFEYDKVSVWTSFQDWQPVSMGPYGQGAVIEVEGSIDYLDKEFGQCALRQQKVEPSDMIVTVEQNDKVCRDDGLSAHQCADPDPPRPAPTKEELCEANDVDISHAEDLCADQQAHGGDIYEGCLFDVCASIDADAQLNAVGGAALEAAIMNPEAKCTINAASCLPCNICSSSTSVDLSNVVQNNLGGIGPDSGAEEIRYKHAIDLDGKKVDVVLTAQDAYKTPKSSKNGYSGTGFGRFTMKTKTSTNFKFSLVDSATDAPVAVKDLALTFYDLDQAKKNKQQETVSACGAQEVYTTSDTELIHTASGTCHSFTSTTRGTGKDNPAKPDELTKTQAARSITYEFHARASISFSASISGFSKSPRPILFSFVPQVACGASDAETQCAQ